MEQPSAGFATKLAAATLSATNSLLGWAARMAWRDELPASPQKICVWRTGNIGDVVCALPALATIRRTWPSAELTLLTSPGSPGALGARELLEQANWIEQIWTYHPSEESIRDFARKFREHDFDLVIRLPQNMSSPRRELRDLAFLRLLARVSCARGFAVGSLNWLGRAAARAFSRTPDLEHESDRQLRMLDNYCVRSHGAEFPLPIGESVRQEADQLLERFGLQNASILCVSPGAKRSTNRWPIERFASIARRWVDDGGRVLVLGGSGDRPLGEQIREHGGAGVTNLCGQSSLLVSTALLESSEVLVSNDTGTMHLAAGVGTPCVVPFSARDLPKRWFPHQTAHTPPSRRSVVHRSNPACSPCWVESCPHQNLCLTEISVDQVWDSTIALRGLQSGTFASPAAAI